MRLRVQWVLPIAILAMVGAALPAGADHSTRPSTDNIHAMGHSPHPASFFGVVTAERQISSDIAFWGRTAFHGNYDGFRVVDISAPGNPKLVSHPRCNGDQGDIVVWEDILVRTWNSPAPAGRFCDGEPVPVGFEGLHVWDISDPSNPVLIGEVELSQRPMADRELQNGAIGCGSHTATLAPDLDNNRLVVYTVTSVGAAPCNMWPFMSVVEVPLDDPASAHFIGNVSLGEAHHGHDVGVILGDVNMMAVPGHEHTNVFSIGEPGGGSLENPMFLYDIEEEGVCNVPGDPLCNGSWHSAAFTWDGEVIILGWEPGGGAAGECAADDPDVKKSMFFYSAEDGSKLGQWVLPRAQQPDENCTIHNYNIVPTKNGTYVAVGGHYQAGTWVTEFTDPANPTTVAFSDPPPLGQVMTPGGTLVNELGGAWSSYWYNGFIYESEITKGLNVFRLSDKVVAQSIKVDHLNPQTQEFTLR